MLPVQNLIHRLIQLIERINSIKINRKSVIAFHSFNSKPISSMKGNPSHSRSSNLIFPLHSSSFQFSSFSLTSSLGIFFHIFSYFLYFGVVVVFPVGRVRWMTCHLPRVERIPPPVGALSAGERVKSPCLPFLKYQN